MSRARSLIHTVLFAFCAGALLGQAANQPAFEVASIKPSDTQGNPPGFKIQNGRFHGRNVTVKLLVAIAYGLQDYQISGGPGWVSSDGFDIEAKAEGGTVDREDVGLMLQSLLADRFRMSLHRENKETSIYALVVAKDGPRIELSSDQTPGNSLGPKGNIRIGAGSLVGTGVPLPLFVSLLGRQLGRTIDDRTDLKGRFDIELQWTPDIGEAQFDSDRAGDVLPQRDNSSTSIFTAIQQQLGLKLQAAKGVSGFLVIDHVEKPSEN